MATKPDQGYAYVILLSSFLGHFIMLGMCYSMGVFYVEFREVFRDSDGSVALMASLSTAFLFQIAPLSSLLTNRFGPRAICFLGALLAAFAFSLSMFSKTLYVLYLTFGILPGIGLGLAYIPIVTILGGYFVKRRSLAYGLAVSGAGFGNLAFSPLTQFLLDLYGWRGSCLILSGVSLNLCVVAMLLKPALIQDDKEQPDSKEATNNGKENTLNDTKSKISSLKESQFVSRSLISLHSQDVGFAEKEALESHQKDEEQKKPSSKSKRCFDFLGLFVFRNLSFCLISISNLCVYFGTMMVFTHLAAYAGTVGLSPYQGSFLLSFIGIGNLGGRILSGIVVNIPSVSESCLYTLEFFVCGIFTAAIPMTANFVLLACISVVFGMIYGSMCAVLPQIVINVIGLPHLVTAYGYMCIFAGIGCLIGSPVAEVLFDKTGLYTTSFYLAGVMLFLAAASMVYPWWMIHHKRYEQQSV